MYSGNLVSTPAVHRDIRRSINSGLTADGALSRGPTRRMTPCVELTDSQRSASMSDFTHIYAGNSGARTGSRLRAWRRAR